MANFVIEDIPKLLPTYTKKELSPYKHLEASDLAPEYHFAPELIKLIM